MITSTNSATTGRSRTLDPTEPTATTEPLDRLGGKTSPESDRAVTSPAASSRITDIGRRAIDTDAPETVLDITIPVYNEEKDIETCIRRLGNYLEGHFPYSFSVTVADNASTDQTLVIAERLARELPHVRVVHLDEKGRGNALRRVWSEPNAAVLVYMDVDLSTDLAALQPLVAPLLTGHSDLAIGSRLARNARVVRGAKREFISRSYNLLLRTFMGAHFSDAQCGFKAIRADVARQLIPHTGDGAWFFDTEMLVLAERIGLRVAEVPVDWTDDPDSSVDVVRTATDDLKGMVRLSAAMANGRIPISALREELGRGAIAGQTNNLFGQVVRFCVVGVGSTLAYIVVFLLLRSALGAQWANFAALLITAVANTGVNRFFTFGVTGRNKAMTHHVQGLLVFGLGWALTSGALWGVHQLRGDHAVVETGALVMANLMATLLKFLMFRWWVFRPDAESKRTNEADDAARTAA